MANPSQGTPGDRSNQDGIPSLEAATDAPPLTIFGVLVVMAPITAPCSCPPPLSSRTHVHCGIYTRAGLLIKNNPNLQMTHRTLVEIDRILHLHVVLGIVTAVSFLSLVLVFSMELER